MCSPQGPPKPSTSLIGVSSIISQPLHMIRTVHTLSLWFVLYHGFQHDSGAWAMHPKLEQCADRLTAAIMGEVQANTTTVQQRDVRILVAKVLLDCERVRKDVTVVLPAAIKQAVDFGLRKFANRTGKSYYLNAVTSADSSEAVFRSLVSNRNASAELWVVGPGMLRELADTKQLKFITNEVYTSALLNWNEILPLYRNSATMPSGEVAGMPLDGGMLLLYYRKDVFSRAGLNPPDTWDDVQHAAQVLQDTTSTAGTCLNWAPECKLPSWYVAMLAPMMQYAGTSQGLFFDPRDMTPLLNGPAAVNALKLLRKLLQGADFKEQPACPTVDLQFLAGECAITIDSVELYKRAKDSPIPAVKDNIGVVQLPGHVYVWERSKKKLVACTSSLCPYADRVVQGSKVKLVNRAPFTGPANWVAALSATGWEDDSSVYELLGDIAAQQESLNLLFDPKADIQPFRMSHLLPANWVQRGYNEDSVRGFLHVLEDSIYHPNVAPYLQLQHTSFLWSIMASHLVKYLLDPGAKEERVLQEVQTVMTDLVASYDSSKMLAHYQSSISYEAPPPAQPPKHSSSRNDGFRAWMALVPALIAGAIILGSVLLFIHRRKAGPLLKGQPPLVSPFTTLVVTDIQDSTTLWETLAPDVMDAAIKLHHQVIRKATKAHHGYESATEGDAFILAFHNARDAVLFCLASQLQLLEANWPPQLLALDHCRPFYVKHMHHGNDQLGVAGVVRGNPIEGGMVTMGVDPASEQPSPVSPGPQGRLDWLDAVPTELQHAHIGSINTTRQTDDLGIFCMSDMPMEAYTFRAACQMAWKETESATDDSMLIFRGLKVRMGVHACAGELCVVTTNPVDSRQHYTGPALVTARNVADAAQGGMVLMSEGTYKHLRMEELWEKLVLLHCGEHLLKLETTPVAVYQVYERSLFARAAYLGNVRSSQPLSCGAINAPLGRVAIVFMYIVGVQSLMAWSSDVTKRSLAMFHDTAQHMLQKRNGYQVEAQDNLLLAAFNCSADAISWCLETKRRLLQLDWPPELLKHELGEELTIAGAPTENGTSVQSVIMRGLRAKAGIDTGEVRGSAHAMTGRMTYRGRVMNRAARIVATATSGQVLCSGESWQNSVNSRAAVMHNVEAISLGKFQLKGVAGKMEIDECRFIDNNVVCAESQRAHSVASYSSLISTDSMAYPNDSALSARYINGSTTLTQDLQPTQERPTALSEAQTLLQHLESMLNDERSPSRRPSRGPGLSLVELPVLRCQDGLGVASNASLHEQHNWVANVARHMPLHLDDMDDRTQGSEDDKHAQHDVEDVRIIIQDNITSTRSGLGQHIPTPAMTPRPRQLTHKEFMRL